MPETTAILPIWLLGAIALGLGGVLAIGWFSRRRSPTLEPLAVNAASAPVATAPVPPAPVPPQVKTPFVQPICAAFLDWLAEYEDYPDLWSAFDQMLRELLGEHLGAGGVRCYHVRHGSDTLIPISQAGKVAAQAPSSRDGILGHVVTTGTEYAADDPNHGPLVETLARQDAEGWAWIWPVRFQNETAGVLAVRKVDVAAALPRDLRHIVGGLLTLCWRHVDRVERLRLALRTDKASGGLTRHDFFALAERGLAESYRENEPVVVAVLALEGMRRLDDAGRWHQRDALIEHVGEIIGSRIRSDDLVGRFADDRFVVLLRRLDSGLGRLIAEKLLAAATECVQPLVAANAALRLRVGLAGSGVGHPSLEELLVAAFDAVDRARKENASIGTDLLMRSARPAAAPKPDTLGKATTPPMEGQQP